MCKAGSSKNKTSVETAGWKRLETRRGREGRERGGGRRESWKRGSVTISRIWFKSRFHSTDSSFLCELTCVFLLLLYTHSINVLWKIQPKSRLMHPISVCDIRFFPPCDFSPKARVGWISPSRLRGTKKYKLQSQDKILPNPLKAYCAQAEHEWICLNSAIFLPWKFTSF